MNTISEYPRCAEASAFLESQMCDFASANLAVAEMAERCRRSGVDIHTLVDHWVLPPEAISTAELLTLGFARVAEGNDAVWEHPQARLPRIRLGAGGASPRLALATEDVALFLEKNALTPFSTEGDRDSSYEVATCPLSHGELQIIARRGDRGFGPGALDDDQRRELTDVRGAFENRLRSGAESEVIDETARIYREAVGKVGPWRAVEEFFAAERVYYMARNSAARWQYAQQQMLGIGWANHDHHTYRSSRDGFRDLMSLWRLMGFAFRERFYAGAEAGWGAQILEHPVCRIILFCDVDIAPEELEIDYARVQLETRDALGTIGLWCGLHGSSIAQAGMHHLECEFDFPAAQAVFEAAGFAVMAPFTDMPTLKQAFTLPEMWRVDEARLQALVRRGAISDIAAEKFREAGANGSHVEILQRWDGFKGFNKTGVSAIIRDTDARRTASVA